MLGGLPRDEAGQPVVFDGAGNRISQSLNDCLTTRFVYDGPNVVMEMSAGGGSAYGGNVSHQVIWAWVNAPGLDQPVERIAFINGTSRQRQVFHADGLGSIAVLTDESGATVQTYAYAAFGSIRTQTGTDLNRVTFTAREALGDSLGFFYYRYRTYDPNTGRFTTEDIMGFIDGPNRYVYCVNNPINRRDPFGLQTEWFPTGPDVPNGAIFRCRFDMPAFPNLPLPSLSEFRWHGLWGGPGWAAGQWKPESSLVPSDMTVVPRDRRDMAYREHDVDICERGGHSPFDDMRLGWNLLHVPPWQRSFWMTSRLVPMPAPMEALFWFTGLPGLAQ